MANWYDNVPAPVDSNGSEVPLDTKELVLEDGKVFEVGGLEYRNVECSWVADLVGFPSKVPLTHCTLHDSWERLEEDAACGTCHYFGMERADGCNGCPAKSDDDNLLMCHVAMASDIIRRAKALAGVTDGE